MSDFDLDDERLVDMSILSLPPHLRSVRLASLTEKQLRIMRNVLDRDMRHTNERLTEIQNAIRDTESQKKGKSKNQIYMINQHLKTLRMNENGLKGELKIIFNLLNIIKPFLKDEKLGAGRKKGGKFDTDAETTSLLVAHDLPRDIKRMRRLLTEAYEEIFIGDDITARQDLKEIGRILEEYNVLVTTSGIQINIPPDILQRYDELLELLSRSGAGFSRERETTNGNLRQIGGKVYHPRKPSLSNDTKIDHALESDEEDWGFPYRFTDEFVDRVEEIYDLINDNGDYEQARDLFQQYQIGTIFREDYQRLRNDMRDGMDLDGDDETFIKDLKDRVEGIIQEFKQHFGKRMRGGMRENLTPFIFKKFDFSKITSLPALNQAITLAENLQNKWITFKKECEDDISNNIDKKKNVKEKAKANLQIERYQKFLDDLREMAIVNYYPK